MEQIEIDLSGNKKLYFASDFHLGVPNLESSQGRERKLIRWLDFIASDAHTIFLLGDIFDFWFEYKKVVPKGFVRFLGKLATLSDNGTKIVLFKGNHDMWMFDYLQKEIGCTVYSDTLNIQSGDKKLHVGHGDGLGPGDRSYKFLRKIFRNRICIWLFRILPTRLGMGIAHYWSKQSRISNSERNEEFKGEKEFLLSYCRKMEENQHFDYYIFGHRHLVIDMEINNNSRYVNLGEWVNDSKYAVFDGERLSLETFK